MCSICKKFGHTASQCYYNNTNNVQQALPPPHQQYDLNNPNLDMPVAHLPRDQLPVINRNCQLQSGVPFSTASSYAPGQSASSSRYVNTPGSVVYDISFLEFVHIIDHLDTASLQDLPATWLKPHLILCDSGASTSVAPSSFAPHIKMEPFQNDITLKTATSQPINIIGYKDIHLISKEVEFGARFCITSVKRPLLGLADIISSNISLNISRDNSNIYSKGKTTELSLENNKLLLNAILVLLTSTSCHNGSPSSRTTSSTLTWTKRTSTLKLIDQNH